MTPTSTSTIPKAKKTNVTWESVVPLATQSHHRRSTSIAKINLVCGGRREESTVMLDMSQTQKSESEGTSAKAISEIHDTKQYAFESMLLSYLCVRYNTVSNVAFGP